MKKLKSFFADLLSQIVFIAGNAVIAVVLQYVADPVYSNTYGWCIVGYGTVVIAINLIGGKK